KVEIVRGAKAMLDVFQRAAELPWDGHGEGAIVIMREHVKGQADLAQIVRALNALCPSFALAERRQEQRRQNGDDGHDSEQFDQGEGAVAAAVGSRVSPRPRGEISPNKFAY